MFAGSAKSSRRRKLAAKPMQRMKRAAQKNWFSGREMASTL
jgi:hypothetical protein